jgi:hypothetical protein
MPIRTLMLRQRSSRNAASRRNDDRGSRSPNVAGMSLPPPEMAA